MSLFYKAINVYNSILLECKKREAIRITIDDIKNHNLYL